MTLKVVFLMLTPRNLDPTKHLCHVTLIFASYWKVIKNQIKYLIILKLYFDHVKLSEVN